jgi:hypothetical protein
MRTTLTLDDDVAALVQALVKKRKGTMREIVNSALRDGLVRLPAPSKPRERFETESVSLGRCLLGNVDNIAEVIAHIEVEDHR